MTISKELYDCGFRITGEGRRIDIIDLEDKKYKEIFFFPKSVLVMSPDKYEWAKSITSIVVSEGLPKVNIIN